ncbi:uncharacterized protein [Solanum lycopersicum]|uniref:uncharacterized protein n=1 Tax=Solanum lycopersicum TaxID=4081 RepID=UPI003748C9B8
MWWRSYVECQPAQALLNWASFSSLFMEKYIPQTLRDRRRDEFLILDQGRMSVTVYEAKFRALSRLTKSTHFIPVKVTYNAEKLAKLYISEIVRLHGVPLSIISDRGMQFTSKFWKTLYAEIGTRLDLSTAFHPQTDGQSERMIQGKRKRVLNKKNRKNRETKGRNDRSIERGTKRITEHWGISLLDHDSLVETTSTTLASLPTQHGNSSGIVGGQRLNMYYDLQARQHQEGSPDVTGTLLVFDLDVYALLNPGATLSFNGVESSFIVEVKEKQDSDPILLESKVAVHNQSVEVFSQGGDGVLCYQSRLCVTDVGELRQHILAEAHNSQYLLGATKMYHELWEVYRWYDMKRGITNFVSKCPNCQQVKVEHQELEGMTQEIDIPTWKWDVINMDFITGLLRTRRQHDLIRAIVDRRTKSSCFLVVRITNKLYINEFVRLHWFSLSTISDRGPQFTSYFWKSFQKGLGTQVNLSTTFHPQTDGKAEHTI